MREQVLFAIFFPAKLFYFFSFLSLLRSEFAISPQHHSEKEDISPSSFIHSTLLFETVSKDSQRPEIEEGLLRRIWIYSATCMCLFNVLPNISLCPWTIHFKIKTCTFLLGLRKTILQVNIYGGCHFNMSLRKTAKEVEPECRLYRPISHMPILTACWPVIVYGWYYEFMAVIP